MIPLISRGLTVSDLIAILGSIDYVMATSIDRIMNESLGLM